MTLNNGTKSSHNETWSDFVMKSMFKYYLNMTLFFVLNIPPFCCTTGSRRRRHSPMHTARNTLPAAWEHSLSQTCGPSPGDTCTGWLKNSKLLLACYTLVDNFGKYGPISIILSLLQSVMNCGKWGINPAISPQICCRTTLWKLKVQQYDYWVVQNK